MQRVYAFFAIAAAVSLLATSAHAIEPVPCQACCDPCAGTCGASHECTCFGCGCCDHCVAKIAAIGYFNCKCRGSYNYPVPPLYTYHWPGMYSLKSIPAYNSPYRYPPLELPAEETLGAAPEEGDASLLSPIRMRNVSRSFEAELTDDSRQSDRPEKVSQKLRRVYGLN